jgi:hypothetical protein
LAPWKGSVTRCGSVTMLARGVVAAGRGKGEDDVSWADTNLAMLKMMKNHTVDPVATNG